MINQVSLLGRVSYILDYKEFASGAKVVKFNIAVSDYVNGEEKTHYIKCEAWGKLALLIKQYAPVGKQLAIAGKLQSDNWVEEESGRSRSSMSVRVATVELLASAKVQEVEEIQVSELTNELSSEEIPF